MVEKETTAPHVAGSLHVLVATAAACCRGLPIDLLLKLLSCLRGSEDARTASGRPSDLLLSMGLEGSISFFFAPKK